MTDPSTRHGVCPECHTHQPLDADGRIPQHLVGPDTETRSCPGGGEYPNRVKSGRYSEGSHFESCPAATGERLTADVGCTQFPDGAHRCAKQRRHMSESFEALDLDAATPRCTCQFQWSCIPGQANLSVLALAHQLEGK
jgi:hypothetical protein